MVWPIWPGETGGGEDERSLCATRGEEPSRSCTDRGEVDLLLLVEDVQFDQIMGAVVAATRADRRTRVELLCHLMVECHYRDGLGRLESEVLEEIDDVRGDPEFVVIGAPNLVMTELESHAQPVSASIGEHDSKRAHQVGLGNSLRS